jgi:quercetin dioxygenase-like cupin family protein
MKKIFFSTWFLLLFSLSCFAQNGYKPGVKVELLLKTDTTAIGQKIVFPQSLTDEVTIAKVTLPPGTTTGWHKHMRPVFAFVVSGVLKVRLENGLVNQFKPNSTFAEVIDTYHEGFNDSTEDIVLIAFYLGEKGQPLSLKKP